MGDNPIENNTRGGISAENPRNDVKQADAERVRREPVAVDASFGQVKSRDIGEGYPPSEE